MSTYQIGNWAQINDGGDTEGDSTLEVSCGNEYFGRTDRSGYATLTTDTHSNVATLNVVQSAAAEFVTITPPTNPAAGATSLVVTGYTNSSKLTFSKSGTAASAVTIPSSYTASYNSGGTETTASVDNGAAISGDPGQSQRVGWSITLTLTANTSATSRSFVLTVTPNSGTAQSITITQSAGEDYIAFDSASGPTTKTVTFNVKGAINTETSVDVSVYSNDDWSITTGTN